MANAEPVVLRGYPSLAERALTSDAWRANRSRLILSVIGVALGVALGVAVHLINSSALSQFTQAARSLSGDANLAVRGTQAGFDENVYPKIALMPGVDVASPVLDFDVRVPGHSALHVVAIDPFQALRIQPALLGNRFETIADLLKPDTVVLSRAAADELELPNGGELVVQVGTKPVSLRIVAVLAPEVTAQRIAFTDIATAQWRLDRLGLLNRIDLRIAADADLNAVSEAIARLLPDGVQVGDIDSQSQQAETMTRAYRVNLDMLALVALFTGAFLVFATQALTILQRRAEIAILRVIGVTRGGVLRILLTESMAVGAAGASIGLLLGYALAWFALARFGGDLGAGYFNGTPVSLNQDPLTVILFFALGVLAALAGCLIPAWKAAASDPAPALKAANLTDTGPARPLWPGLLLIVATLPLLALPPIGELPFGGYAAIGTLLAGALWLVPAVAELIFRQVPPTDSAMPAIAIEQLRGGHSQLSISIAAIVVSFSLMVAMLIMIGSFRGSLEQWLGDVLPADAYVRAGSAAQSGFFDEDTAQRIATLPSVASASAVRVVELPITPGQVPATLLARDFDPLKPDAIPLVPGTHAAASSELPPIWISEAASDLNGWHVGNAIELTISGKPARFVIAGIWRDYTRQNGTLLLDRPRYKALTGDARVNDVWVWLKDGASLSDLSAEVERVVGRQGLVDVRDVATIRRASLALFDRTFAVTYVLQAVAVLIGMFGISVGFSSQVLARRAEFGVLRHIGVTRRQIAQLLGIEGLLAGAIGIAYGIVTGGAISIVLIRVINRQSFHWSMDLHVPVVPLLAISLVLVLTATATAMFSGRSAMSTGVIAAVKDDW
jgi:putative ABC transport system permease protein